MIGLPGDGRKTMKKISFISSITLILSFLLIVVFAIGCEREEAVVDGKAPPRYKVTFATPLDIKETKELLRKYDVQLLHITYTAPGFSGTGLVTNIDRIEDVAQNIIRAWTSDASDRSLSEEERSDAKRFLSRNKDNPLKASAFEGIGHPEESLRTDMRVKRVEEF